jgi:hypothetical protein
MPSGDFGSEFNEIHHGMEDWRRSSNDEVRILESSSNEEARSGRMATHCVFV